MQVMDPATGGFTSLARASFVAQIDNQARTAIEAKFTAWLGEHGDELLNSLPTCFGQVPRWALRRTGLIRVSRTLSGMTGK